MPKKFPDGNNGFFSGEDPTCGVICSCGYGLERGERELWVSDHEIVRCPKCGRGYKTEFFVWVYEKDEEEVEEIITGMQSTIDALQAIIDYNVKLSGWKVEPE